MAVTAVKGIIINAFRGGHTNTHTHNTQNTHNNGYITTVLEIIPRNLPCNMCMADLKIL